MNWQKIADWTFYVIAAFLVAWFIFMMIDLWGTMGAPGYFNAALWLSLYVLQHRLFGQQSQLTKSALAGWKETLKVNSEILESNDSLLKMVGGLKADLNDKNEQLASKSITVVGLRKVVTPQRPAKRLKVKTANVKRRRKLRR